MSFHEDQIKSKLLDADIQNYRKLYYEDKKTSKKRYNDFKKPSPLDLSEWSTNQKTTTLTSFPTLKFASQNIKKTKPIEPSLNQTFTNTYFTKLNFKPQDKTSLPIQINLSFNPQETTPIRKKQKRISNSLPKQLLKSLEKAKKDSLQNYMINGKIKFTGTQNKQTQNTINRSDHLLRLLRQRELLRMKRYSFDIDGSLRTKSCLSP